jgi:hypothetical protein
MTLERVDRMTTRLGLLLPLVLLLVACDSEPSTPGTPDADQSTWGDGDGPVNFHRCSLDGRAVEHSTSNDTTWMVEETCGEFQVCVDTPGYLPHCGCSAGLRCTSATDAYECCPEGTARPVAPGSCEPAGHDDELTLVERQLAVEGPDGTLPCSSPTGLGRFCGPSSTCDDEGGAAWCACQPSESCIALDCAEGAYQVTVECPADPHAPPVYRLCEA